MEREYWLAEHTGKTCFWDQLQEIQAAAITLSRIQWTTPQIELFQEQHGGSALHNTDEQATGAWI